MGVTGLASLLDARSRVYREAEFCRSRLVIDGCNLVYLLYFRSGLDQNHGGEYAAFEEETERFIAALRTCGITPYVVLDGGSDQTDKKLETVTQRAEQRIHKAHQAALSGRQENILPQLARYVFRQTLARLEVPVAQCFAEADQEIAALATEWSCPVLSNDSDFYIFNLPAGLLPISHFRWQEATQSGSRSYIPCRRYYASSFCVFFGIQRQLLPTFATLAGNDYVKLKGISWAQFAPAGSERTSRLEGLLCWLRAFQQPQDAIEAALGLMGNLSETSEKEVLQTLYRGMEEYKLGPSTLRKFFIHGVAPLFPAVGEDLALIPPWTRLPLTQARLTSDILDVLLLQRLSLRTAVDHADLPSCNLTSRPLRQLMYGLLLGRGGPQQVVERDRDGLRLTFIPVKPSFSSLTEQISLSSLPEMEPSERLQVLLEALGVTEDSLRLLGPELKLPVAATCYWLQRAEPPPDQRLLKALLLGMSSGERVRTRAALQAERNLSSKANSCIQRADVTHAINQWQACLTDSMKLNQLLGRPLPEPEIARLFQGTLVHQLLLQLSAGRPKRIFRSDRASEKQYDAMLSAVHRFRPPRALLASENQQRAQNQPLENANLRKLFLLHEDEENEALSEIRAQDELRLQDGVFMRTRYRTKDRSNRTNQPELARKEASRGFHIL
ncbi:single-strand DNA endonuclease ASTE1 [Leuresthes tenuis]|uniref:single-strand DNA endonuclease ASTE1 n=1 Tax=Leuresthes tenuis TaxID=355514 RepID=UPI003B500717